jgi:N-ethylmaleimide reductase
METNILYTSIKVGKLPLTNRLVMAPLTRGRADADRSPNDLMAEYYEQRATAGLIVTEATAISPQGYGWAGAPALYNAGHVEGWRKITNAVHRHDGRIFLQLWHMGRVSHPDFQAGALPVGPSPIAAQGDAHTPNGKAPYVTPRPLETSEIAGIVRDYASATRLARDAWFDGVEIHGANGYLVDQFLRDGSNHRTVTAVVSRTARASSLKSPRRSPLRGRRIAWAFASHPPMPTTTCATAIRSKPSLTPCTR